jgi:hypothetical protein
VRSVPTGQPQGWWSLQEIQDTESGAAKPFTAKAMGMFAAESRALPYNWAWRTLLEVKNILFLNRVFPDTH